MAFLRTAAEERPFTHLLDEKVAEPRTNGVEENPAQGAPPLVEDSTRFHRSDSAFLGSEGDPAAPAAQEEIANTNPTEFLTDEIRKNKAESKLTAFQHSIVSGLANTTPTEFATEADAAKAADPHVPAMKTQDKQMGEPQATGQPAPATRTADETTGKVQATGQPAPATRTEDETTGKAQATGQPAPATRTEDETTGKAQATGQPAPATRTEDETTGEPQTTEQPVPVTGTEDEATTEPKAEAKPQTVATTAPADAAAKSAAEAKAAAEKKINAEYAAMSPEQRSAERTKLNNELQELHTGVLKNNTRIGVLGQKEAGPKVEEEIADLKAANAIAKLQLAEADQRSLLLDKHLDKDLGWMGRLNKSASWPVITTAAGLGLTACFIVPMVKPMFSSNSDNSSNDPSTGAAPAQGPPPSQQAMPPMPSQMQQAPSVVNSGLFNPMTGAALYQQQQAAPAA